VQLGLTLHEVESRMADTLVALDEATTL
jgi:hypothetical protein